MVCWTFFRWCLFARQGFWRVAKGANAEGERSKTKKLNRNGNVHAFNGANEQAKLNDYAVVCWKFLATNGS